MHPDARDSRYRKTQQKVKSQIIVFLAEVGTILAFAFVAMTIVLNRFW